MVVFHIKKGSAVYLLKIKKIDWALNVTGTSEFRHRSINDLSGGQRQRVWIAMALAQKQTLFS